MTNYHRGHPVPPGEDANHAIDVRNLTVVFEDTVALRDVSVAIPAGAICGLVGPNGSGKSTLMRCLFGHLRPTAGTASILDVPVERHRTLLGTIGAVAESIGLDPKLTGRRTLRALAHAASLPLDRIDAVLNEVDATDFADRRVEDLSTGMRQRIALAVALLGDPRILVLDEPQNGLDPEGVAWLRNRLIEFARAGGTVLISSHLLVELESFIDHIVVLRTDLAFAGSMASLEGTNLEDHFLDLMNATDETELA